jgi:hypothetical protein
MEIFRCRESDTSAACIGCKYRKEAGEEEGQFAEHFISGLCFISIS